MSRQPLSAIQLCGVLVLFGSYLTDRTFQGGPHLLHSILRAGLPIGIVLACYGTPMLVASLLLAGSDVAILILHLRGWPVVVLLLVSFAAIVSARFKEFKTQRRRGAV